jgi:endonuclease/exonuclease/phosphatase family metal-dependent hydrolase
MGDVQMIRIRSTVAVAAAALLGVALATPAPAADQTILGRRLVVKNPSPADASRRKVIATAKESGGGHALVGDPTVPGSPSGAMLGLIANGGTSTARAWALPQGTTSNGEAFWRTTGGAGFRYDDPKGDQGPVRSVLVKQTASGALAIKVKLLGRGGPIDVVPPNPGTDGFLVLELAGGDRYCAQYGPEAASKNDGERFWKIARPTAEGCALAGELLLLNYNVAGLPQGISGSDPEVNMPLIGPLLNGYDLVLVQESWQTPDPNPLAPLRVYHEILRAQVDHPYESIPAPHPLGLDPSRPTAILSDGLNRFSRFPMEPVIREAWDGCHTTSADCLAFKGFSMARTTFAPGVVVDVYNLHMEAGGAPEDDALRDAAVTQVLDFMAAHSAGRAVIVAGDFNLHIEDEPDATQYQRMVDEGGLADACEFLSCPGPFQIEKVLFRGSDDVELTALTWSLEDSVFLRDDLEPLSDHPALAVRFAWATPTD